MRVGDFKLWRSAIVCWSCFVAFSVISFLLNRARTIHPMMLDDDLEDYERGVIIWTVVVTLLAAGSFVLALRVSKRRGDNH